MYQSYSQNADSILLETILGHNMEDLFGLEKIFHMLGYPVLFNGGFVPKTASLEDEGFLIRFELPASVPVPVSKKGEGFYFTCQEQIPGEETAMPKALSRYMDKSLRRPAKPETCFTWFRCDEGFLKDSGKQSRYLNSTLPCLLQLK